MNITKTLASMPLLVLLLLSASALNAQTDSLIVKPGTVLPKNSLGRYYIVDAVFVSKREFDEVPRPDVGALQLFLTPASIKIFGPVVDGPIFMYTTKQNMGSDRVIRLLQRIKDLNMTSLKMGKAF